MARSFQIVEYKVAETDFFLKKLQECSYGFKFFEARNYMSAFLSASRSITFSIQASIQDITGFDEWYGGWQVLMRESKLSKYFLEARNYSQKVGYYPIVSGGQFRDEQGVARVQYDFDRHTKEIAKYVPEEDVITACNKHFVFLLELVLSCYERFGTEIDPEQYFSFDNLRKTGKTIEDFEIELGYPRGWTSAEGLTDDERLQMINREIKYEGIDHILVEFLGKNRFGDEVNPTF